MQWKTLGAWAASGLDKANTMRHITISCLVMAGVITAVAFRTHKQHYDATPPHQIEVLDPALDLAPEQEVTPEVTGAVPPQQKASLTTPARVPTPRPKPHYKHKHHAYQTNYLPSQELMYAFFGRY